MNNYRLPLIIIMGLSMLTAQAQKLPNIQKQSVLAPADIKIDGKPTEWGNKFQAYNHATDIFYTVSNDKEHLYLTVQATDPEIINKIIGGGITFTIQKTGKKNDKDGMSITYPIFDAKKRPYLRNGNATPMRIQVTSAGGGGDPQIIKSGGDDKPTKIQGDSAMMAYNKRLNDNSKFIGTSGFKDLDTLVSVYNEEGIKTAEAFNTDMAYTYELSVDLKHLGISAADAPKIAYHITVNASNMFTMKFDIKGGAPGSPPPPEAEAMIAKMRQAMGGSSAATDFWGEYTLTKGH